MEKSAYEVIFETERTHWWYRVRRVLAHRLITSYAAGRKISILDVGCGPGALLAELSMYGEAIGIDNSPLAVNFCKERGADARVGEITKLPFPDASFDVVLVLDVLEHIEKDALAAAELARILKPGGQLIAMVPAFMILWGLTDVWAHHYRRYTKSQLVALLSGAGLTVRRAAYFNFFLFPIVLVIRKLIVWLKIPLQNENKVGGGLADFFCYYLFLFDVWLLKYISYPVGISCLAIAEKK